MHRRKHEGYQIRDYKYPDMSERIEKRALKKSKRKQQDAAGAGEIPRAPDMAAPFLQINTNCGGGFQDIFCHCDSETSSGTLEPISPVLISSNPAVVADGSVATNAMPGLPPYLATYSTVIPVSGFLYC